MKDFPFAYFNKKVTKRIKTKLVANGIPVESVGICTVELKQEEVAGRQAMVPYIIVRDNGLRDLLAIPLNMVIVPTWSLKQLFSKG